MSCVILLRAFLVLQMVGPVTDPSMLSPVSCLSISGKRSADSSYIFQAFRCFKHNAHALFILYVFFFRKRTAQNFQMANAKGQKAQMLGHNQAISIIDDQYRNDPMPLKVGTRKGMSGFLWTCAPALMTLCRALCRLVSCGSS